MADRSDAWVREVLRLTRRIRSLEADSGGDGDSEDARGSDGGDGAGERGGAAALRRERARIAERHDHGVRVRESDGAVVCYPLDWFDGDTVDPGAVDDTDRAVELRLGGGEDDVASVREANDPVVDTVLEEREDAVGYNAAAFAEYLENHHRCRIADASPSQVARFLEEYYPRNVWPPDGAEHRVEEAVAAVLDAADRDDLVDWLDRRGDQRGASSADGTSTSS